MGLLCILAAALLTLSGINDTGKFLEETAKTFKIIEKSPDSNNAKLDKKSELRDAEKNSEVDKYVASENPENGIVSDKSNSDLKDTESGPSTSDVVKTNKKTLISDKISSLSNKYNKNVLSPLSFPSQVQKNLGALVKPLAEFFSAGYVALGYNTKGSSAFQWFDTLTGKPNEKLLELQ